MTELLAERKVQPGGVIAADDVAAIRAQLGEPYEFADDSGDIAVGSTETKASSGRRLYRSVDDAMLGGVLSGVAAYFKINPLWTRLAFVLVLFGSFGFASLVYILFWIMTPQARTATEKLQMAGKDVTVNSIKEINAQEEVARPNHTARTVQTILSVGLGSLCALSALGTFALSLWLVIAALGSNTMIVEATNNFAGLGDGAAWVAWLLFWVVVTGMLLLTSLFALIAYAFFAKKITKKIIISGVVIIVLGVASVATVLGVGSTQSLRVANESRSLVRETKATITKEFNSVTAVKVTVRQTEASNGQSYFLANPVVRYVVDEGPARYELSALPTAKLAINTEGENATINLEIPASYRNSFVQPAVTVYGPALSEVSVNELKSNSDRNNVQFTYEGTRQDALTVQGSNGGSINVSGRYESATVKGRGIVDLSSSTVALLVVQSEQGLNVSAGTIRDLQVTQPDVCPSGSYGENDTRVTVASVTTGKITYNGSELPANTHRTNCAAVIIDEDETYSDVY